MYRPSYMFDDINNDGQGRRNFFERAAHWLGWHDSPQYAPEMVAVPPIVRAGQVLTANRGATAFATGAGDTDVNPVLSLRMDATDGNGWIVAPEEVWVDCDADVGYLVHLILNPTVAGTDQASWADVANSTGFVGTNARVQRDIARNNTNSLTGGTRIWSAYAQGATPIRYDLTGLAVPLEHPTQSGVATNQLVLAVQNLAAADNGYLASLNFRLLRYPF